MRTVAMAALLLFGSTTRLAAQTAPIPPRDEQVAAAVLPLPEGLRAGARVLGYDATGKFVTLREGKGMVCLAQYPREARFHVSCYHESLEPFMGRGRELRAAGTAEPQVDTVRFAEVKQGKLKLPDGPAALYQIFGTGYDPKTQAVKEGRRLYVLYVPFATGASTGLSERPRGSDPWIMLPGTPKAHIMFTATMQ
ncbi:MAG: hypothetical protein IT361_10430 [Gemmatimonadaceae bacterium]|nr:hypothetical protein [Gemmatimonadaceae bacterium]